MSEVISFGGINIDLVVYINRQPNMGETVEGDSVQFFLGGKGANQAVGLSRLGANVDLIGKIGDDIFGKELISNLKKNGEFFYLGVYELPWRRVRLIAR